VDQPGSDWGEDPNLLHDFIDFYKTTFHRTFGRAYRAAGRDKHVAPRRHPRGLRRDVEALA
jgi:hypothetical protein